MFHPEKSLPYINHNPKSGKTGIRPVICINIDFYTFLIIYLSSVLRFLFDKRKYNHTIVNESI